MPVALDPSTGARQVFESVFVDVGTPVAYMPRTFATAPQVRDFVEAHAGRAGATSTSPSPARLHELAYEGVACTRATIRSGGLPGAAPARRRHPRARRAARSRGSSAGCATSRKARQVIATRYVPVA